MKSLVMSKAFFLRPSRLGVINRTIIWLFDEESSDVKGLFLSPSKLGVINRTTIWLFDEKSSDVKGLLVKSIQVRGDR